MKISTNPSAKRIIVFFVIPMVSLLFFFLLHNFSDVIFCADGLSDQARSLFANKSVKVVDNFNYWNDQAEGLKQNLEELEFAKSNMSQQEYEEGRTELLKAYKDSCTHLNSERRMIQVLNRKAEEGDLNTEVGSSTGKRSNVNAGFQEPSSKR